MAACRLCGGTTIELGRLGNIQHSRCRNCGMMYTREVPPKAPRIKVSKPKVRKSSS